MSERKRKCGLYSVSYFQYVFIPSQGNRHLPMCLICGKVLSNEAMKPSQHPEKANKDVAYIFERSVTGELANPDWEVRGDNGLRATYNISLLIAKSGQPHSVDDQRRATYSNDRVFRKICQENDESYNRLLLHTLRNVGYPKATASTDFTFFLKLFQPFSKSTTSRCAKI
ncbi:hypothetical protein M513_00639 [Trichuris suis]|uniref:Uncharacterized protein n=1 Tax=Trichuris suis TaxID=68888 RepID=A0A085MMG7_9BILA|nr:hypothetical protein M513_00639 [Trichuris suis]